MLGGCVGPGGFVAGGMQSTHGHWCMLNEMLISLEVEVFTGFLTAMRIRVYLILSFREGSY